MKPRFILFAAIALIPAMSGSAALAGPRTITAALCGGGTIDIPVRAPAPAGGDQTPCCAKGCHTGSCSRKRLDKSQ